VAGKPIDRVGASFNRVGVEYFKTLQIPLVAGRTFSTSDTSSSTSVAIISQALAQMLHESNPIGQRLWVEATPGDPETQFEIVGVARDAKFEDLREEPLPVVYLATAQDPYPPTARQFLIRSNLPSEVISASVNRKLMEMNPGLDVTSQNFRTMVQESLLRERLMATLSGFFGVLALVLASIGLYGLLSYGVASRRSEIGIRMALGASARNVLTLILREAVLLVLIGVAIGVPIVLYLSRFARSLLFELSPTDPMTIGLAGAVLLVVALLAGYLPARRATKVDPLIALRDE
jgi:predicted permease